MKTGKWQLAFKDIIKYTGIWKRKHELLEMILYVKRVLCTGRTQYVLLQAGLQMHIFVSAVPPVGGFWHTGIYELEIPQVHSQFQEEI